MVQSKRDSFKLIESENMKNGNFAIYHDKEYSADYIKNKGVVLRSPNIEDVADGFKVYNGYNKTIACVKFVDKKDLQGFYRLRTKAIYLGYKFAVVEEKDDLVSIVAMTGDYRVWEKMGMHCIDKGVYQKWINKKEAEIKVEKEAL